MFSSDILVLLISHMLYCINIIEWNCKNIYYGQMVDSFYIIMSRIDLQLSK